VTDKHYKAFGWCVKNNIKVYMVPIKNRKSVYIEIDFKGKKIRSPKTYAYQNAHPDFPNQDASSRIWQLYLYLYEQNNKDGKG
tara:strand:- start:2544 stop:2792 length:249 start_codon:yes stop_codon:yes gene_type:complete